MKIAYSPIIAIFLAETVLCDLTVWGPPLFRTSGKCCPRPEKECDDGDDDDD